ncbi:MAG: leucine-rich repeat protein [Alphaproteobacteria bacterium]|nr:leucine-rich repeat protein [Alphaproteobacteria bacterium]
MKKFLFILIGCVFYAYAASAEVKTYVCGDNCTATLDENGVMTISGTGEMYGYNATTRWNTPWMTDASKIKSVVVESGITNIGRYAFYICDHIKNIELAPSVKTVDGGAFDEVRGIQYVTMSDKTVWENQDNINDYEFSPTITIHCRGVLSTCEENLTKKNQQTKGVKVVAKLGKRIYTVEEASKVSKKTGNTFMIRYK